MEITRGNVTVKLYETPVKVGGVCYPSWTVAWNSADGRKRKRFKDYTIAERWATDKADALNRGYSVAMTADEAASVRRASDLVIPTGRSLELIAQEAADAYKETGVSIGELSRFWKRHHIGNSPLTVRVVADELIETKRKDKLSPEYIHDLEVRLGRFAKDFPLCLADLTSPIISDWLKGIPGQRSRKNYRRALTTLFEYARERRYLPRDWDEIPKAERSGGEQRPIEIYTPEELKRLVAAARWPGPELRHPMLPMIVLGAFAGIRTWEIRRLAWDDIGEKYIAVKPKRTKRSASRRLVEIQPTLKAWLDVVPRKGAVCHYKTIANAMRKVAARARVKWKQNALRHSYISYRIALTQNVAQVALECGNSPQMIHEHYREPVTPEAARDWFAVRPKSVAKGFLESLQKADKQRGK